LRFGMSRFVAHSRGKTPQTSARAARGGSAGRCSSSEVFPRPHAPSLFINLFSGCAFFLFALSYFSKSYDVMPNDNFRSVSNEG